MSYQQVTQHCSTEPHAWAYDHMWHIRCMRGSHIRGGAAFDSNMDYTDIQYGNWTVSFRPIMLVAKLSQFSSEFVCCGARLVASPSDARCARPCRGFSCLAGVGARAHITLACQLPFTCSDAPPERAISEVQMA